ncbi:ATPase domain-containing protein [Massilia sp. S19_KUP03_FR1]|uniref:ATPase domain-containing protein n=1 Tax=Massilia sp. S19_KUP03_FR1 TaxID=3025503 RepID=UPI003FA60E71
MSMTESSSTHQPSATPRMSTGIAGLDTILGGGLTPQRIYLVEGTPGTGKTTVGLQFLLEGVALGERGLYITLSETQDELEAVAASHGWSIAAFSIVELASETELDANSQQSIFHSSEVELGETARKVMTRVDDYKPARVVFDSLSELRLLAQNPLRYRRQILALKQFFSTRACTVLLLDDRSATTSDQQLHSIAHGVIRLEQLPQEFGKERRRVSIVKMRGIKFRGGFHDYILDTGGIVMFPRLVAADHSGAFQPMIHSTGMPGIDAMLGGGLAAGTNTLVVGPSGIGKTTLSAQCLLAALQRGEAASLYLFDEGLGTFFARTAALAMDLSGYIASGQLKVQHVDPAELAPGEFAHMLRGDVENMGARFIVIDSLNAYLQAMPGEQYLTLQMHELLTYLNGQGVTTVLILGQHGLIGDIRADIDMSYLSDATLMLRFFESNGRLHRAVTAIKSRISDHALTIHELRIGAAGIEVGAALEGFEGVLSGLPTYRGKTPMLRDDSAHAAP